MGISREHVVWAYRLFLGREPESDSVIDAAMGGFHSVADLRAQFLGSPEFLEQNRVPRLAHHENVVIKEIDGARLFVDLGDYEVGLNIINGIYEPAERDFIRRVVGSGELAVDVGANIGFFSILLDEQVGESGHVYSFESLPRNALLLKRSVDENGFASRITVERAAVGADSGAMDLISARMTTNSGAAYLRTGDAVASRTDDVTPVRVIALDRYQTRRPISFIKLDAEGAELLVLRGASELITNDRPVILAEINPPSSRRSRGVCQMT